MMEGVCLYQFLLIICLVSFFFTLFHSSDSYSSTAEHGKKMPSGKWYFKSRVRFDCEFKDKNYYFDPIVILWLDYFCNYY